MRYADIKKESEDKRQNQTTTNINYIKKFLSVLKTKLNKKIKINCNSPEKNGYLPVHNKAW